MNHAALANRYGARVIGDAPDRFNAIELHGMALQPGSTPDAPHYTINDPQPALFSVFLHLKEGGIEAVGDFGVYDDALDYAQHLMTRHGWPIHHYSVPVDVEGT